MWSKSRTFIHNDDVKCFHVVVQRTHKLVVMGHIKFGDHALINKWRANEKMNVWVGCSRMKKNEVIVKSNLRLLLKVVRVFEVSEFTAI